MISSILPAPSCNYTVYTWQTIAAILPNNWSGNVIPIFIVNNSIRKINIIFVFYIMLFIIATSLMYFIVLIGKRRLRRLERKKKWTPYAQRTKYKWLSSQTTTTLTQRVSNIFPVRLPTKLVPYERQKRSGQQGSDNLMACRLVSVLTTISLYPARKEKHRIGNIRPH